MRVDIDPEQVIPAFYESHNHSHHDHDHPHSDEGCLQGAFDYLLEEKH